LSFQIRLIGSHIDPHSTPYLNISIDKPGVASDELPEGTSVLYEKKERVEHGRK
jgi:hypothetical protein